MPRAIEHKNNFTAGELSPRVAGRRELSKYGNGVRRLENLVVQRHGGATHRPGTRHVAAVKNSANATRLIEFAFSVLDTYILEFGDQYVRFYRDGGQLEVTAGTPTEIVSPYSASELAELTYVQSADVLYLEHPDYAPRMLTRKSSVADTSNSSWSITTLENRDGPWLPINETDTTLTPDSVDGTITITASAVTGINDDTGFQTTDVGRLIRLQVGRRLITDMDIRSGGAAVFLEIGSHSFQIGDSITVSGTKDYDGTHTILDVSSTGVKIPVTWTYDQSSQRNEVQDVDHDHTGGTFTLTFLGQTTSALNHNATTAQIQTALQALSTIGSGNAAVTGTDGTDFTVTFQGTLANTDVDDLIIDATSLTGGSSATVAETFRGNDGQTARVEGVGVGGGSSWYLLKITARNSTTEVECEIPSYYSLQRLNAAAVTKVWRLGAWSDTDGWPWSALFHQNRLWFGGSDLLPQTEWGSVSNDFDNFEPSKPADGTVEDDDAITRTINDNKVNSIRAMAAAAEGLVILTDGGSFIAVSESSTAPLTPTSFNVRRQTTYGAAEQVRVHQVGDAVLFIDRVGPKLRELKYNFSSDRHIATELSILGEHLLREGNGVVDTAWQGEPEGTLWIVRSDGLLISATYLPEHEVIGLAQHPLGGVFGSGNPVVESVAVIREGLTDQVWLVVKRTVDGNTVRHIEYIEAPFDPAAGDELHDADFLDASVRETGGGSTLTGLGHLEGETVRVLADGVLSDATVASGQITVTWTSDIVVGLKRTAKLETNRLEPIPDSRGRYVHPAAVLIDFLETALAQVTVGVMSAQADRLQVSDVEDEMVQSPSGIYTGIHQQLIDAAASRETWLTISMPEPLPMTIRSLEMVSAVNDV